MAVNFNPPLTDVLKTGEPVQKGQVSALFGVLRDAVNADLDPRATPIYASRDAAIAAAPPAGVNTWLATRVTWTSDADTDSGTRATDPSWTGWLGITA